MRFRFMAVLALFLGLTALVPVGAFAAVSNVQGDIVVMGAPPSSVSEGDLESDDDIVVFAEAQNITLSDDVITAISEPGAYSRLTHLTLGQIPAGTEVNTYLLHSDPIGRPYYPKTFEGSVEFEEDILGIIVTGLGLIPTDDELGAPGTDYSNGILFRGVELLFDRFDSVTLDEDMHTVTVRFETSRRVDQIRVVTAAAGGSTNEPPDPDLPSKGLVAYWSLDADLDQTAVETINGFDGTLGGDVTPAEGDDPEWVAGRIGSALSFDGDDYVLVDDQPEFHLPEYTWSLWVNGAEAPNNSSISQPLSNGDQRFVMSWDHTSNFFIASAAHAADGGQFVSAQIGEPLMADTWYHVAATFDGTVLTVYLDGVKQSFFDVPPPANVSGPLHIGAGVLEPQPGVFEPGVHFEGMLDEVRIYDRALSTNEVDILARQDGPAESVDLMDGLAGHWAFDDNPQDQVVEDSAGTNDGTRGADASAGSDDPAWDTGVFQGGNALTFDGADDFVKIDPIPVDTFTLPVYSWSLWVNADFAPGGSIITQPFSNADKQFVMSWDHTAGSFVASAAHAVAQNDYISVQIGSELMADTWYHIAATFDGTNLRMYLDGELSDAQFIGEPPIMSPGPVHIGAGVDPVGGVNPVVFFPGSIDDVRIYDRVLNKTEIASLSTP